MRTNIMLRTIAAFVVGVFASSAAAGQTFTPAVANKPDIRADLMVGDSTAARDETWLGVDLNLGPGWKTYWKSPGDAGLPTEFDWSGSSNVIDAEVQWPAPSRLGETGADYLAVHVGLGTAVTDGITLTLLVAALTLQMKMSRYVPWIYWLSVVLVSVVGTQITDALTDGMGVSLYVSTPIFAAALHFEDFACANRAVCMAGGVCTECTWNHAAGTGSSSACARAI